jgi:CHAT domain-containing protein
VHFCGHAVHEPQRPERSGWVFDDAQLLIGANLEGAERPPRLVFANACASAQLQQSASLGLLEGLVDSCFQRGVRQYIGTAWSVPSEATRSLALAFYGALFGTERRSIGEALLAARQIVSADEALLPVQQEGAVAATWTDYQHCGDPTERFHRPSETASITGQAADSSPTPLAPKPLKRKVK